LIAPWEFYQVSDRQEPFRYARPLLLWGLQNLLTLHDIHQRMVYHYVPNIHQTDYGKPHIFHPQLWIYE